MKLATLSNGKKVVQLEPGDYRVYTRVNGRPLTPWIQGPKR